MCNFFFSFHCRVFASKSVEEQRARLQHEKYRIITIISTASKAADEFETLRSSCITHLYHRPLANDNIPISSTPLFSFFRDKGVKKRKQIRN